MTVPFWCLLVGALLPYVWTFARVPFVTKELGPLDNKEPRVQIDKLTGKGARLVAAQSNAWEALAIFTPAVLVNHLAGADAGTAATLALVWVGARTLHGVFYMQNLDMLRSLSFLVGLVCVIWLFVDAARA